MTRISYDFHIHSCLSPCGDNDMTPENIAGMAYLKQLDAIALTDHNSCRNCEALIKAAKQYNLTVICGMELTTVEEVHVICLFESLQKALDFDKYVYSKLQKIKNDPKIFGDQIIYNSSDIICDTEEFLLINATNICFEDVFTLVKDFDGIAYPAHIDRSSNSLISNLGFIPNNCNFNTVEFADILKIRQYESKYPYIKNCKVLTSSDAHNLAYINEAEYFLECRSNSVKDILAAIK